MAFVLNAERQVILMKQETLKMRKPIYKTIKEVRLNKDGILIGKIIRWKDRLAYLTWRNKEHYYRKNSGFCVDKNLLLELIQEDYIDLVIVEYKLVNGDLRYFISDVDTWILNGEIISYTKERDGTIETYGTQLSLNQKYMTIFDIKKDLLTSEF